jgi:hypothetical protein
VEEARQHTPLTVARWGYLLLLLGGPLILLIGIVAQLAAGGDAIGVAVIIYILTRLCMAATRILCSGIFEERPKRGRTAVELIVWFGVLGLAVWIGLK